jgi:peptidylprolyl isomerase
MGEDPGTLPTTSSSRTPCPGDGEEARAGDTVTVHYVGAAWSTGEEFDASWDRGSR